MLFSLYSQISLYKFWLKAWLCSASDQKYSFKITFLKMILSWLQNYVETLGGRTAWSWHLSCVQTVVKLQLHSVLAALYLLSTLKNAHFLLTLFQTVKREKATSQVLQRLPQRNLFLPSVCRWAPQKQPPLPQAVEGAIALWRFLLFKDKAAAYLCQFKYWLFLFFLLQ